MLLIIMIFQECQNYKVKHIIDKLHLKITFKKNSSIQKKNATCFGDTLDEK